LTNTGGYGKLSMENFPGRGRCTPKPEPAAKSGETQRPGVISFAEAVVMIAAIATPVLFRPSAARGGIRPLLPLPVGEVPRRGGEGPLSQLR